MISSLSNGFAIGYPKNRPLYAATNNSCAKGWLQSSNTMLTENIGGHHHRITVAAITAKHFDDPSLYKKAVIWLNNNLNN